MLEKFLYLIDRFRLSFPEGKEVGGVPLRGTFYFQSQKRSCVFRLSSVEEILPPFAVKCPRLEPSSIVYDMIFLEEFDLHKSCAMKYPETPRYQTPIKVLRYLKRQISI